MHQGYGGSEIENMDDQARFLKVYDTAYDRDPRYWTIKKFAGKLKQIVSILTGISVEDLENQDVKNTPLGDNWIRYGYADGFTRKYVGNGEMGQPVMNNKECSKERYEEELRINWQTAYKVEYTPRVLLQYIGTELFRNQIMENIWVNALFADYIPSKIISGEDKVASDGGYYTTPSYKTIGDKWIVTDVRFKNEFQEIKKRGGINVRIERPGTSLGTHASETDIDDMKFDWTITNAGSMDDLVSKVREMMQHFKI